MVLTAGAGAACRGDRNAASGLPIPGENGARVTVEVLNASGKPGLARVGTRLLRRASIDVVAFGNAPDLVGGGTLDSTRVVVRRGGPAVGMRIRRALGVGRVVVQLDSARLLDASVFLGADFTPTGLEFHP
jgi:hypothetical protein